MRKSRHPKLSVLKGLLFLLMSLCKCVSLVTATRGRHLWVGVSSLTLLIIPEFTQHETKHIPSVYWHHDDVNKRVGTDVYYRQKHYCFLYKAALNVDNNPCTFQKIVQRSKLVDIKQTMVAAIAVFVNSLDAFQ